MLEALSTIIKDIWEWRDQIRRLAVFELLKKARGTALGWAWLFIKPGTYLFCFWFALEIGLRSGSTDPSAPPFFLWLCAGMIPWFFMQDMLGLGVDTLHRYPYLVNKIKFPIGGIPAIYTFATLILQLMLLVVLFVVYFLSGMKPDIYLLQVPILLIMMLVFWYIASMMFSLLSGMSKDFANLMSALSTPFFWLSGAIFDVNSIGSHTIQRILDFNPITFFINAFRDTFYYKTWFWENTSACVGFAIVFVITLVVMLWLYKKVSKEVADVL
ncbi:MAG: ABC transporter permease [Coriobacteriales bacterium]|jgi:teichoic acid transport system permease protein